MRSQRRTDSPFGLVPLLAAAVFLATGCATARSSSRVTSSSRVALPSVVGEHAAAAKAQLEAVGLETVTLSQFSSQPRGVVIGQGEPAGTRVAGGTTVALTVSAGAAHSAMPHLDGMRAGAALAALRRLQLAPLSFTVFSDAPRGTVVSSFPAAGTAVGYDGQARVDVSGGPPPAGSAPATVPDVRGIDAAAAQQRLRDRWLVPNLFYVRSSESAGSVVRQTVAAGTRARLGTLIGLALSLGPHGTAATPVPYVVGRPPAAAVALLSSTGFHVRVVTQRSPAPARSVIDEQPMGGTKAPAHAVVTIVVAA